MAEIEVCPVEDLPPGAVKIVHAGEISIGVYNLGGEYHAIEDRCSHDDGPLCEGEFDLEEGYAICPRHVQVETFPVRVENGLVMVATSAGAREP